jgi:hypothetical protein
VAGPNGAHLAHKDHLYGPASVNTALFVFATQGFDLKLVFRAALNLQRAEPEQFKDERTPFYTYC